MKRIVPGIMLAGCWLLLLLSGSFSLFWVVVSLVSLRASYEYLRMVLPSNTGDVELLALSIIHTLPVFLAGLLFEDGLAGGLFFAILLSVCYVLVNYSRMAEGYDVLCRVAFGALYVGFFAAHLVLLWRLPEGNFWLIILVAITAGSDSGAYFSGKRWGKHKLCKNISPNKTIEGACGGLVCGVAVAVVMAALLLENINWPVLIPMAMVLTGAGIVGDLCESIVKRGTGTKDSGRILLGHGGVLDRVDSLLLAAPLLYYLQIFPVL